MKKLLLGAVALLYLLHNDVWFWHEAPRLAWAGTLPAGFVYHVGFCLVVALVMWAWVSKSPSNSPFFKGGEQGEELPPFDKGRIEEGFSK